MTPVLIVLLVWGVAAVAVAGVLARVLSVREDRDRRAGDHGTPDAADTSVVAPVIDLTALPQADAGPARAPGGPVPAPGTAPTDLPRAG